METVQRDDVSLETFTEYKKVLLTLVSDLKQIREVSARLGLNNSIQLINEMLTRIENNSFTVAVVGEFKRGKSTFINALLGKEILPADILPCSATINRITYGISPLARIMYKDGREEEVPIDKIKDYVTKLTCESEELAATVREAVCYYPIHYCQNNVDIIDTPGLNDESCMTDVTLSVLPICDAAIMVIMAQAPFSEYEREFLETKLLTADLGRIIFVVTGIDRCNDESDAERIISSIRDKIQKFVMKRAEERYGSGSPEFETYKKKIGTPRIFGLSAYQALAAKRTGNLELLRQSRMEHFEAILERFLAHERGAASLQIPINRLIAASGEILRIISIQENGLAMKKDEFKAAYDNAVSEIKSIREKKTQEMKLIDSTANDVKNSVRPLIGNLEEEMKQAASQLIAAYDIKPADIRNTKALNEKLARKVSAAVQKVAQKTSEDIQSEIEKGLAQAIDRLKYFETSLHETLHGIEMEFTSVEARGRKRTTASGEGFAAALAVVTGFGGIWSGYREAGVKGAAVGAVGSLGTCFAGGAILALLGLPVTFPVIVAVGIVSIFTGGWLTKRLLGKTQVENFKANFTEIAKQEIEKQLKEKKVQMMVNDMIKDTFDALRETVHKEVESLLDDTQKTLEELRGKREREEVTAEQQASDFAQMGSKVQQILGNAQRLSQQLIQQVNV